MGLDHSLKICNQIWDTIHCKNIIFLVGVGISFEGPFDIEAKRTWSMNYDGVMHIQREYYKLELGSGIHFFFAEGQRRKDQK